MRLLTTFTLITICFTAIGQTFQKKKVSRYQVDTLFPKKERQRLTYYPYTYIDTEYTYSDSTGISVIIQNSLRKAGGTLDSTQKRGYTDAEGKNFGYAIFWTRVINETTSPLELSIHFPADSFAILPSPDSYFKVFLPTDTMTLDKESLYNYGATGLKPFLDTSFHKPSSLKRAMNPKEACLFYILAIYHHDGNREGRGELILKGQDLFYKIESILIPCGKIVFKK